MENIITIGYDKGKIDFGVNVNISDLSYEQMNRLRIMTMVAIGQAERMWSNGKPQPGYTEQSFIKDSLLQDTKEV